MNLNGSSTTNFRTASSWRKPPQDLDQRFVVTPYGKGLVLATRREHSPSHIAKPSTVKNSSDHEGVKEHANASNGDSNPLEHNEKANLLKQKKFNLACLKTRNGILKAIRTTQKQESLSSNDRLTTYPQQQYMQVVELVEWDMSTRAGNQGSYREGGLSAIPSHPLLYTTGNLPSTPPMVGDDVICSYGRGSVSEILKSSDSTGAGDTAAVKYKVILKSWRLAGRSSVVCFLSRKDVFVVRKKVLSEMDVHERVEHAQFLKGKASKYFAAKLYKAALEDYRKAVDAVRYVQHDSASTNEVRADLVEVMITCCNNAATCCWKVGNLWHECERLAMNALMLIEALIEKKGKSIHKILVQDSGSKLSDVKLFGEFKVKSLLLIAKAQSEKHEYRQAIKTLKQAKEVLDDYLHPGTSSTSNGVSESSKTDISAMGTLTNGSTKALELQEKEVKRQLAVCAQHVKMEKQKEKARAVAMFGSSPKKHAAKDSQPSSPIPKSNSHNKESSSSTPSSPTAVATALHEPSVGTAEPHNVPGKFGTSVSSPIKGSRKSCIINSNGKNGGCRSDKKILSSSSINGTATNGTNGTIHRRVSFHKNTKGPSPNGLSPTGDADALLWDDELDDDENDNYEETWFDEHKEALILAGVGGALACSFVLARSLLGGNRRN